MCAPALSPLRSPRSRPMKRFADARFEFALSLLAECARADAQRKLKARFFNSRLGRHKRAAERMTMKASGGARHSAWCRRRSNKSAPALLHNNGRAWPALGLALPRLIGWGPANAGGRQRVPDRAVSFFALPSRRHAASSWPDLGEGQTWGEQEQIATCWLTCFHQTEMHQPDAGTSNPTTTTATSSQRLQIAWSLLAIKFH